jgi:hypothetical protein
LSYKEPGLNIAPVRAHSVKPEEVYERIEALVDIPSIFGSFTFKLHSP